MIILEELTMSETEKRAAQNNNFQYLLNALHPIGSLYISRNDTNPSELFGGTWERIKGRFIYGIGDNEIVGCIGGEKEHILTTEEIPSHSHSDQDFRYQAGQGGIEVGYQYGDLISGNYKNGEHTTGNTGGNVAHNNMPPYIGYYIWERTA